MAMSFRRWLSIFSFAAIVVLLILSWKDITKAWRLLEQVQPLVLALIIPVQIFSFYASGEILASFLRAKGELKGVSRAEVARFSLEFNFVNHILPSGGLSGASYANWRFKHMGVPLSRVTLANALRFLVQFVVFNVLLVIAVIALALDGNINRLTLLFASTLSTLIIVMTLLFMYVVSSSERIESVGHQITRLVNGLARKVFRRANVLSYAKATIFLGQMHADYVELRRTPRQLLAPALWALTYTILEIGLFTVVFASLHSYVNPAAMLIAYGFAGAATILVATPGGAGAYEAVMISFLSSAGTPQDTAIAGVLLTRVIIVLITIVSGYIFYQLTLVKYGKMSDAENAERKQHLEDHPDEHHN